MDFLSFWPIPLTLAVIFAIASTSPFAVVDAPSSNEKERNVPLDGLRGLLAIAVVFHHGAVYHRYLVDGVWKVPPSNLYTNLGQSGVAMFFMVTAYLFWGKVLLEQRRAGVNWVALAIGRFFRIAPIFWLATFAMLTIVGISTDWTLAEAPPILTSEVLKALSLGVYQIVDVNGFTSTTQILAGVTWSLQYEWAFYVALPLLAAVYWSGSRISLLKQHWSWMLPALGLALSIIVAKMLIYRVELIYCSLFCIGMIVAACKPVRLLGDALRSIIVLLLVIFILSTYSTSYSLIPIGILGIIFMLVASGCTVFGLLTNKAATRLGDISFGIYMLQGLALAALYWPNSLANFARTSPFAHWLLFICATVMLVVSATIAHICVERPGIAIGRWVAAKIYERKPG